MRSLGDAVLAMRRLRNLKSMSSIPVRIYIGCWRQVLALLLKTIEQ
jgi:hypothetical protein